MTTTTTEIPQTMRAATIVGFNAPIEILNDVKVPEVPDNRILVNIKASSLCWSDLMAYRGYIPSLTKKPLPYCGGHEPVGVIAKLGSAVRGFKVGDRVGYMMFTDFCGTCPDCFAGGHRYCKSKGLSGFADPYGGFSEYALADPASTLKLPDDLDFDVAASLFCAGITAYSALLRAKGTPGRLINIVGCGGVGHIAILLAKAMGHRVNAYDVAEDKIKLAIECGADKAINSITDKEAVETAPATIVISGANAAYADAIGLTFNHGVVVGVGIPPEDLKINFMQWSSRDVSFVPVNTSSISKLAECLDLAARHKIKPKIEVRHIDTINEGYKDLAEGKIEGRIVYHFHQGELTL